MPAEMVLIGSNGAPEPPAEPLDITKTARLYSPSMPSQSWSQSDPLHTASGQSASLVFVHSYSQPLLSSASRLTRPGWQPSRRQVSFAQPATPPGKLQAFLQKPQLSGSFA